LQNALRGTEFETEDEIRNFVNAFFQSKAPGFFVRGFTDLIRRWEAVIEHEGEYPPED